MSCKYDISLDHEEIDALGWIEEVLKAILAKGKTHKSFHKATACVRAFDKIREHRDDIHVAVHLFEQRNMQLVELQMVTQPLAKA